MRERGEGETRMLVGREEDWERIVRGSWRGEDYETIVRECWWEKEDCEKTVRGL